MNRLYFNAGLGLKRGSKFCVNIERGCVGAQRRKVPGAKTGLQQNI